MDFDHIEALFRGKPDKRLLHSRNGFDFILCAFCYMAIKGGVQNYEMCPEAAAAIDEYCKGANITLEEHWLFLEESAPNGCRL